MTALGARGSTDLHWLPDPGDWDRQLAAAKGSPDDDVAWDMFLSLSRTRLDFIRTSRLDRACQARFADAPPATLATRPVRLAVLSSSTVSHLLPSLRVGALRKGLWLRTYTAEYGQYFQDLVDPSSALARFAPTEVLIALDAHHMARGLDPLASAQDVAMLQGESIAHLTECWRLCRERLGVPVIQQTVLPVFDPILGSNEHRLPGSRQRFVTKLNEAIRDSAADIDVLAIDTLCARDGVHAWHERSFWLKAKQEIAHAAAPLYGDLVARLVAARQGRSFKCLILDLDNTLWGGVIGDDGINGIVVGPGSAYGESFLAFQKYARDLSGRGVILAVCSKNDEHNARQPFIDHPDMILRLEDFSAFVANWDDKAQNIRRIADTLNLGLDSMVFVDDNPFERNLIRSELPMVAVPEVPEDPVLVAACLADAGYFESLRVTPDDRLRTAQYRANAARTSFAAQASNIESYLRGLDMQLICQPFDRNGLARTTQLINKTNQFNLTTQRYTEQEVAAVMTAPDMFGLQFRLQDRFGDNGMIAVVIGRQTDRDIIIDTWLISCRVLGRRVEHSMLLAVADEASRRGAARLVGLFRPSAKNAMVRDHYLGLGFQLERTEGNGTAIWALDLSSWEPPEPLMAVRRD